MKRCSLFAFLFLLTLASAPAAFATAGDCFTTCDIYGACDQTCQDCIVEWDTDQCIQWRPAECQWYGLCGQPRPCFTVKEWDEYTPVGNWFFYQYICYDRSPIDSTPPKRYEEYARQFTKKHYKQTNCNGVITTTLVSTSTVYSLCDRQLFGFQSQCNSFDYKTSFLQGSCPF